MAKKGTSELQLIDYIRKKFPHKRSEIKVGIGDDAMVLAGGLVVSTDSFAEGVHFDFSYFSMYDLGWRAMAASLSDLAAMAAHPVCALVSLYLPKKTLPSDIKALYRGFQAVGGKYGIEISGGDIVESPFWGVTITVVGKSRRPLLRSGARPGHALAVTGHLGLAEVGRSVLQHGFKRKYYPAAIEKHLHPKPRIREGLLAGRFASAGIDTSDGLSTDAFHISVESRVKVVIEAGNLMVHPEVRRYCNDRGIDPVEFILASGEDFELLFAAKKPPANTRLAASRVGRIEKGKGLYLETGNSIRSLRPCGYEHLK